MREVICELPEHASVDGAIETLAKIEQGARSDIQPLFPTSGG